MPKQPATSLVPAATTAAAYSPTPAVHPFTGGSTTAAAQVAASLPQPAPVVQSNVQANGAHNLLRNRQCRQTGARVHLHSPVAPGTTFTTTCVTHAATAHYPTRKAAKAQCYTPANWCSGCAAVVAAKQAAATAALAAATAPAATPQ